MKAKVLTIVGIVVTVAIAAIVMLCNKEDYTCYPAGRNCLDEDELGI
ncbi:MAG: hypothetical protein IKL53_01205 [Lachnospiraceae bacterium]|nr:hypothetical protein [Lachnospiraceae bacterium]